MESIDVSLRLLGPMRVEVGGQPVTGFRSHKTLALFAYLIVEQRPVARNYLAELFWPDATHIDARAHLRRALHDLSQKVPGALLIDHDTARFNLVLLPNTDLAQLEQLRRRNDSPSLEMGATICRGQFLEGIALNDCPAFELWLMVEREVYLNKATRLLERLLEQHSRSLQYDQALQVAWQLLQLDPWHEERYRQIMVLLARSGDLTQAIKVYKRYRHTLTKELALEPAEEIESLHQRIHQARSRRPGNIPHALTPFFGREQEAASLTLDLADPDCRLITLTGLSGVGKTRLAIEAVNRVNNSTRALFFDGAYLVHLDEVTTPAQFLARLAHTLGITSGGTLATLEMVVRRLQGRESLLLLDGFEHLMAQREMLTILLTAAPGLKLLVTCQERLKLPAERAVTVKGLDSAIGANRPSDALTLLQALLQTYGRYPLSAEELALATRICQLVEGMPLAIELAAARMSAGSIPQLARELEHNIDALSSGDTQCRHASVRAALDASWRGLKPHERETLKLLAIFTGEFTVEAALGVAQIAPWQLAALVDKSLVEAMQVGDAAQTRRYHLHPLVRRYAFEKLARNPELYARVYAAHEQHVRPQPYVENAARSFANHSRPEAAFDKRQNLWLPPIEHYVMA